MHKKNPFIRKIILANVMEYYVIPLFLKQKTQIPISNL